jgi:predicted glycogen debranching enzyme
LPTLRRIADAHLSGTRFGIAVDPRDGLLRQGAEGYQLTWMDAKVDGWVVTPRRGKAVEINALFYNALRLLAGWIREGKGEGDVEAGRDDDGEASAAAYDRAADRVREAFGRRFWNEARQCLFDVVDSEEGDGSGNDPSVRPNQLLAISLPNPVLDPSRWAAVVDVCERELYTPIGLRSLSPKDPRFKARYFGDLRSRDAAYHQGTVWAWLLGPFVDAWRKARPGDKDGLVRIVGAVAAHLSEGCVGSVAEIFDAEPPFAPRGCFAQAWSVAEFLRCWIMLEDDA